MIDIADPSVGPEEVARVRDVLESGRLADGPEVRTFEEEFSEFCGVEHGVATSNGTTALHTALHALGIGPGDYVLTTPFSFVASANAIRLVGATPVFADVDPETYNLDPTAVEHRLETGPSVDAILTVHLYGLPSDVGPLRRLADEYDVPLVEDAAQAHGARYDGDPVGSFGDVACFSFYPTKNMTTGEGGMVVTDRQTVADRAARYVNHGRSSEGYEHVEVGHNFRMTSLAAAIGRVQLDRLPTLVDIRRANAARLDEALADSSILTPSTPPGFDHAYHQYTVRSDDRTGLADHLAEAGVDSAVYYPTPIHEQPAYHHVDHSAPITEHLADHVLSLPVHPGLSDADVDRIATAVLDYETHQQ
ncbi:DegT/DnrJ/EryC1/StrS family aminotransferase [Halomarina salina]|uniref:DegT/DnrJ/EryC1/StrS family aminotransferase n=1 Tax=Halomarina salina TaxID=1872699 RepID=A0ABD5RHS0_9EURY|nr:DegT/DnrJ/EryC1/StrS family aminotransferase [Halomarina salina]